MERELRDELASCVSREASDADRCRIGELEKAEAELRIEVSRCAPRSKFNVSKIHVCVFGWGALFREDRHTVGGL